MSYIYTQAGILEAKFECYVIYLLVIQAENAKTINVIVKNGVIEL